MSQIQTDLSRDLQRRLGEVLQRQLGIAQHVLSPAEISFTLIEVAVATSLTAAATIAGMSDDDPQGAIFDTTLEAILEGAKSDRDRSLAVMRAKLAARPLR